ncbi:hypothetical protein V2G26_008284 [Clonostachys chloroleuca]
MVGRCVLCEPAHTPEDTARGRPRPGFQGASGHYRRCQHPVYTTAPSQASASGRQNPIDSLGSSFPPPAHTPPDSPSPPASQVATSLSGNS